MSACMWVFSVMLLVQRLDRIELAPPPTSTAAASPSPPPSPSGVAGREVACGEGWRLCLLLGRLLHHRSRRCFAPGDPAPCGGGGNASLALDARALRRGRLRAVCRRGRGGRGPGAAPAPQQPQRAGLCALPDFSPPEADTLRVNCSEGARLCLPQGLLPFEGACWEALSTAPCGAGEWLALDAAAAAAGLLGGACVPRRPCGSPERLRLRATGRCHSERQVRRALCPGAALFYAPTGDVVCSGDHRASDAALTVVAQCDRQEEAGAKEVAQHTNDTTIEGLIQVNSKRIQVILVIDGPTRNCTLNDAGECSPPVTSDG